MKIILTLLTTLILSLQTFAQQRQNERVLLTPFNTVVIRDEITGPIVTKAQIELAKLVNFRGSSNYPIYLVLDTPGGSIFDGTAFIEFTKTLKNVHTITIFAASMGAGIVQALPGQRLITNNGQLMFHRASGGFVGQFEIGEVESRLDMAKKIVRGMESVNASRLKISLEQYKQKVITEWWINADESVNLNAADKVIDIVCSAQLVGMSDILQIQILFGTAQIHFSACPLFRRPLKIIVNKTQKKEV